MWFTQVSLRNPVFATMVMLAIVVLGLFSYQRMQVDQFPNIDFPVVVITAEYPGASPEIVESEVTKKIEEGVNSIAGINALTSRSYEGQSVVIMEFQLYVDGRRAAEDVREKIAAIRPSFRDEVKEPRVLRFDPASRAIWSVAVMPDTSKGGNALSAVELTNWADQVLKKRLENVRGAGSVTLVGGTKREINVYLNPQAMESLGITADQVVNAVRERKPGLAGGRHPLAAARARRQDRRAHEAARRLRQDHRGAQGRSLGHSGGRDGGAGRAHRRRRAGNRQPGALQRPAHAAAHGAKSTRRKHHCRGRRPEPGHQGHPAAAAAGRAA
jgi:HAE1 family hydrophobic/amphiphilic exporter-1